MGCLGRYFTSHLVLLAMLAMMVTVTVLTIAAPNKIVSSVSNMIPAAASWSSGVQATHPDCPTVRPDQVLVDLTQIMKSPVALEQDNPKLIQRIRTHYLIPPSMEPYNLKVGDDPSQGQSQAIREVIGDMRDGFFIECGALDGETRSNTLVFEKTLGWKGLIIEGDPKNYEMVLQKHRKAWSSGTCLSTKPYPGVVLFRQQFNVGKISPLDPSAGQRAGHAEVQCLPIYSLMLALNVTTVDYFSLDVEGVELEVLQTIPWDKVDIKTLSVEFIHGAQGKEVLRSYMEGKGYWVYKEVSKSNGWANDFIFVKSSFKRQEEVVKQSG